ncbi:MAG: hypothetical protein KDC39_15585 [Actinobacteria bacterium]|nr:hypothetical protein [Actinomycetota bacterium]
MEQAIRRQAAALPLAVAGVPAKSRSRVLLEWSISLATVTVLVILVLWSGLHINFVGTDSMQPTYDPTDVVVTIGTNVVEPTIGDAVVFESELYGTPIPPHIHRLVGQEDGKFLSKGDNAAKQDPWRIDPDRISGKAIFSFPGWVIRSPLVLGLILFAFVVAALWPTSEEDVSEDTDSVGPQVPLVPQGLLRSGRPPSPGAMRKREARVKEQQIQLQALSEAARGDF